MEANLLILCGETLLTEVSTSLLEDEVNIIGAHLTAANVGCAVKPSQTYARIRSPITTHVRGSPASGIEVHLEMWKNDERRPLFGEADSGASLTTDKDGPSGQLISVVDALITGMYRISFNTGR